MPSGNPHQQFGLTQSSELTRIYNHIQFTSPSISKALQDHKESAYLTKDR